MRMRRISLLLLLLLLPISTGRSAHAQPPLVSSEEQLTFDGPTATPLQRSFTLTPGGAPLTNLAITPSDLVAEAGGAVILAEQVSVDPAVVDSLADTTRITVTVRDPNGLDAAYSGSLAITYDGLPADQALQLPLTVRFRLAPAVDSDVNSKSLTLAVIGRWWELPYLGRPAGGDPLLAAAPVYVVQNAVGEAEVLEAEVLALRGPEGRTLPLDVVRVTSALPLTLAPQDAAPLTVAVTGRFLPAGEYAGTLLVRVRDQAQPISIPLTIQIRHGPLLPLLTLVVGLLTGLLLTWYNAGGRTSRALIGEIEALQEEIAAGRLLQSHDRAAAARLLAAAAAALSNGEPEAAVRQKLTAAVDFVDQRRAAAEAIAAKAEKLSADLAALPFGAAVAATLRREVDAIAADVRAGGFNMLSDAEQRLAPVKKRWDQLEGMAGAWESLPPDQQAAARPALDEATTMEALSRALNEAMGRPSFAAGGRESAVLETVVVDSLPVGWTRFAWGVQWRALLARGIVYVFALLVGWATLYMASATFGASPEEYITLFLWGAAANTVGAGGLSLEKVLALKPAGQEDGGAAPGSER